MKRFFYIIIAILFSASSLNAQTTSGKDFWLTFGNNMYLSTISVDLQIRIVGGDQPTSGDIYFTNLDTYVHFDILAQQVFTYSLNNTEKQAVYNDVQGTSNRSIHITTIEHSVTVYALNQSSLTMDATNVLPIAALGT